MSNIDTSPAALLALADGCAYRIDAMTFSLGFHQSLEPVLRAVAAEKEAQVQHLFFIYNPLKREFLSAWEGGSLVGWSGSFHDAIAFPTRESALQDTRTHEDCVVLSEVVPLAAAPRAPEAEQHAAFEPKRAAPEPTAECWGELNDALAEISKLKQQVLEGIGRRVAAERRAEMAEAVAAGDAIVQRELEADKARLDFVMSEMRIGDAHGTREKIDEAMKS